MDSRETNTEVVSPVATLVARLGGSLRVVKPAPISIKVAGRELRVRHDDPMLVPYSPGVARIRSAAHLASDRDGLRLLLETSMGDRYNIELTESEVRLRRRKQ